ncbi:MAG: hypothetical protein DMF81_02190 [Acidobacteria bacterium]|nr:MAG: hypothetical protein DMF81_02190 [Acidobacteriota bacterium]
MAAGVALGLGVGVGAALGVGVAGNGWVGVEPLEQPARAARVTARRTRWGLGKIVSGSSPSRRNA